MYFDNYQRQNPPNITQKYQQPSVSLFHQQPVNNYESIQNSQRPYFNRRVGENPTVPSPVVAKNNQQQFYHNRPVLSFHTGTALTNNSKQQSYQGKNNISFNHEVNNSNYNRDNNELIKRRQSIASNNFLRTNQQQSPINNKNISIENGVKNNMRMTMNIQVNKNGQQGQKNQTTNNNAGNISYTSQNNVYKQKQYVSPQMIKQQKQQIQKNTQKQGYYNSNSYSQLNFNQNKLGSKPYATGYKSGVENIDLGNKRSNQPYFVKQNNKQKSVQKDYHYNYQLKNTSSDLNIFNKTNPSSNEHYKLNEQYKYYTPSLSKQSSQRQDTSSLISKNTSNQQVFDYKNFNVQKQAKLTDRQMNKSPSIDGLFNNGLMNKQKQNALKRKNTVNQNTSSNYSNNYLSNNNYAINTNVNNNEINKLNNNTNQINKYNNNNQVNKLTFQNDNKISQNKVLSFNQNKPVSSQNLPQDNSKKNNKNYYALIQNLQKKFSQQKKSSQNFQTRQKNYLQQINKKQQKIKRLQIIIQNNRQTINAMQETIKQLKKKNEQNKGSKQQISIKNGINNAVMMDQLRKQNNSLKQQIKKQRKKSLSVSQQLILKQSNQKQTIQIKQLQKKLQQFNRQKQIFNKQKQLINKQKQNINKQRQTLNNQISKLKQSNTIVQLNYSNQIKQHNNQRKQHTKAKQEIQQFKQQIQNLNKEIQKLNYQKSHNHNSHQLLKSKQYQVTLLTSQLSLLKQKYQSSLRSIILLEEQIQNYKLNNHHQITQYKQKIQELQSQVSKYKTKVQMLQAQTNYKNMKIKTIQQKLSHKTQSQQLLNTSHLNNLNSNLMFQKQCLQSQVITLTNQLKTYENMYSSNPKIQSSPNKNSDSAEIKTLQSYQSNKQSSQYKQTIILLDLYHSKYQQISALFNLSQNHPQSSNQTQYSSLTTIPQQLIMDPTQPSKQQPSKQYLNQYHPLIIDQIKKIHKDMKKLVGVLKQCQTQSQNKSHKLYQLDKTIKKQTNKINSLLGQIHLKSIAIIDINHMQLQKQIFKLNQKYQILNTVAF